MKKLLAAVLLFALAASSLLWSCRKPPKINLVIIHVTLIDGTGAPAQPDMTVVIANQKIAAIGPRLSTTIPEDAEILDATGKFMIPGLTDAHIHLTGAGEPGGSREFILPLLIANGVTTVRDMGSYLESIFPLQRDIADGQRLGPRIFSPGPYLDGAPPSFQPSLVVTNAVEASEDVHNLVERRVNFIKVQSHLTRDAYFGIADACSREHIAFVGHVPDSVTAAEASDVGQKSIEHLTGVLRGCSADELHLMSLELLVPAAPGTATQLRERQFALQSQLDLTYSERKADQLIAKFLKNKTWQTPTLILLKNDAYPALDFDPSSDERNKYIPRQLLQTWKQGTAARDQHVAPRDYELRAKLFQKSLQLVGKMQAAGIPLMAGTDSTAPYIFPGSSLHEELALLVQAGLTPMQALETATKNPAEFLGILKTQGTAEAAKFADLVLLDGNPLDDIHNTRKIAAVILHGKLLSRATLDSLQSGAEKYAASH